MSHLALWEDDEAIYAHCIDGQADVANQLITDILGTKGTEPEPSERKAATAGKAS